MNRFIISSREAGYLKNRFDDTFLHVKINSFNMEQIRQYSKNWYNSYYDTQEDFDSFWNKFEKEIKRARCASIISNPIILILALVIFDVEKNLIISLSKKIHISTTVKKRLQPHIKSSFQQIHTT